LTAAKLADAMRHRAVVKAKPAAAKGKYVKKNHTDVDHGSGITIDWPKWKRWPPSA